MVINKDDITVAELKSFLQSHLGESSSTELFQELMSAKQHEHETPQQFLYRMFGLKQKVLFCSRQVNVDIRYDNYTAQNVFLHTVSQGISLKHSDVRRELRPLLSDHNVSDETLLSYVIKITSDESNLRDISKYNHPNSPWITSNSPLSTFSIQHHSHHLPCHCTSWTHRCSLRPSINHNINAGQDPNHNPLHVDFFFKDSDNHNAKTAQRKMWPLAAIV